jgi:hypothetical protein
MHQRCSSHTDVRLLLPYLAAVSPTYLLLLLCVPMHICVLRERLSQQPSTDEFVAHAALIAEVEAQRPAMDAEYDAVSTTCCDVAVT